MVLATTIVSESKEWTTANSLQLSDCGVLLLQRSLCAKLLLSKHFILFKDKYEVKLQVREGKRVLCVERKVDFRFSVELELGGSSSCQIPAVS